MTSVTAKKCPPAGAPAWIMTFADLMSLLLAFFVLLFSFSELDKLKFKELAGSMRDAFGVQRDIQVREPLKGVSIIAREFSPARPDPTPVNEVRQMTTNELLAHLDVSAGKGKQEGKLDEIDREHDQRNLDEQDKQRAQQMMEAEKEALIKKEQEHIEDQLLPEIQQGLIQVDREKNKLVIRIREKGSFKSGHADLIKEFKPVIARIGEAVVRSGRPVLIAGHTDNVPIRTRRFRSNWELASARAVTVIHELSSATKLPSDRFQIQGYADTKPIDSNDDAAGRSRNRRVEVVLDFSDAGSADQAEQDLAEATPDAAPPPTPTAPRAIPADSQAVPTTPPATLADPQATAPPTPAPNKPEPEEIVW